MQELDVTNVRELEDFLINECMYAVGTIRFQQHIAAYFAKLLEYNLHWTSYSDD